MLVCVVLLVASVLASVRWLLCGGDGSKNEKTDVCNFFKKVSRERIYPHYGFNSFENFKTALNYEYYGLN